MLSSSLANKLTSIAVQQLSKGLDAKNKRMEDVVDIIDLYNNKIMKTDDNFSNIPFPFMASIIDDLFSKIDNAPTCSFKIPNKKLLADKVAAAFDQEKTSMRAGWNRKDRAEKKLALLSGRGIAKIYASSMENKYESHYNVVDPYSFVADPTRGHLDDSVYHGEVDIFRTHSSMVKMAKMGIYDAHQVSKLLNPTEDPIGVQQVVQNKFNRLRALGVDVENNAFTGQKGTLLTEWVMSYENEKYYLVFDPESTVWVRAEKLSDVFDNGKSPFVSWATNYDEFAFWSKGPGDDIHPIAEALRVILNNAIENEKRRTRPMRIVEGGAFVDVNEIMDYVPDNVIITNTGRNPNIIDIQTPQVSVSLNIADYLRGAMNDIIGVSGAGVDEKDAKVGVYYGQLQQEADRVGIINKSYSESYAEKGYRFFWGLKQHLTGSKAIEMLGKGGVRLDELKSIELSDVDDVDDIITGGGQAEQELDAIRDKQQSDTLAAFSGNPIFSQYLNPKAVLREAFLKAGFNEERITELLDTQNIENSELMQEADEAIAEVLEGKQPRLNMGATVGFMQRIVDYVRDNIDYIKLDSKGREIGVDKKMKEYHDTLLAYAQAHQSVVLGNVNRDAQAQMAASAQSASTEKVQIPTTTNEEMRASAARPFENPQGSPQGTAEASQVISQSMR